MKKLIGMIFIAVLFVFPMCANAGSLGTVDLKMDWGWDSVKGNVVFPVLGSANNEPLNYHASINGGSLVDAFCIENVYGSWNTEKYTLYTLDGDYGVAKYLKAAAIAEYFYNHDTDANKAGAQLAIWEAIWDWNAGFNLAGGNFTAVSEYNDEAQTIWDAAVANNLSSTSWVIAHSPADGYKSTDYQDQLVRHNVPEPASLLLLGLGLMGILGIRRKIKN